MSISVISNFLINTSLPIDSRIIATNSNVRESIQYKYDGLAVYQLDTKQTYTWDATGATWSLNVSGNVFGISHSNNKIPKWVNSSYTIENSDLYNVSGKVGVNTTDPKEAFQVSSNFLNAAPPLVIHKGGITVLAENWYYDGNDNLFDVTKGSSQIAFDNGRLVFSTRLANSGVSSYNRLMTLTADGFVGVVLNDNLRASLNIQSQQSNLITTQPTDLEGLNKYGTIHLYQSTLGDLNTRYSGITTGGRGSHIVESNAGILFVGDATGVDVNFMSGLYATGQKRRMTLSKNGILTIWSDNVLLTNFGTSIPSLNSTYSQVSGLLNVDGDVVLGVSNPDTTGFNTISNPTLSTNTRTITTTSYFYNSPSVSNKNATGLIIKPGVINHATTATNINLSSGDMFVSAGDIIYAPGGGTNTILFGGDLILSGGNISTYTNPPKIKLYGNKNILNSKIAGDIYIIGGKTGAGSTGDVILAADEDNITIGRVGIGTNAPTVTLDVKGDFKVTGNVEIIKNVATTAVISDVNNVIMGSIIGVVFEVAASGIFIQARMTLGTPGTHGPGNFTPGASVLFKFDFGSKPYDRIINWNGSGSGITGSILLDVFLGSYSSGAIIQRVVADAYGGGMFVIPAGIECGIDILTYNGFQTTGNSPSYVWNWGFSTLKLGY